MWQLNDNSQIYVPKAGTAGNPLATGFLGKLRLERPPSPDLDCEADVWICPEPTCPCRELQVIFPPIKADGETRAVRLDFLKREVEPLEGEGAKSVAEAMAAEMAEEQWTGFTTLFLQNKNELIADAEPPFERADLRGLGPIVAEGKMLAYCEVFPLALPTLISVGGQTWVVEDHYCAVPGCSCTESALHFLPERAWSAEGGLELDFPAEMMVRYDFQTGKLQETLKMSPVLSPTVALAALLEAAPDWRARQAKRHEQLKWIGVHALKSIATVPSIRSQPELGRNDPCSCGSGKKYKKCCGR